MRTNPKPPAMPVVNLWRWGLLAALILLWEAGSRVGLIDPFFFASPSQIWQTAVVKWHSGQLWRDIVYTGSSTLLGFVLGTLTGKFYDNTVTHTLSASSNTALFNAMKDYFAAGNSVLVLYNGETSSSSGYSSNYARVTTVVLTVTYIEATVWYNSGGTWKQCTVWYCNAGTWVQCVPYYNSGGSWVRV